MNGLQHAIERERWDLVWIYLMLGVADAASKLPRDSLDELICSWLLRKPVKREVNAVVAKAGRQRSAKSFYESALNEAEKNSVADAREVGGIDEEVALLRLRLRTVMEEVEQDRLALMLRGLDALRRLVEVKYRLGEQQREALGSELALLREELLRSTEGRWRMTATLEIANGDTTETNGHGRRVGEAAAFRARVDERLKNLEAELAELKSRINGLLYFIASTVVAQVLMRIVA